MIKDMMGQKFGKLTVKKFVKMDKHRRSLWLCVCICGMKKIISRNVLVMGHAKTCGCSKPGHSKTRLYKIFYGAQNRCTNANHSTFYKYGGRGIKCLWKSFDEFYKDMGDSYKSHVELHGEKDTTIDRIDNRGNYCKENCRWATHKQQVRNSRYGSYITFAGKTQSLKEWAEELGFISQTLSTRLHRNKWTVMKAFTTPIK